MKTRRITAVLLAAAAALAAAAGRAADAETVPAPASTEAAAANTNTTTITSRRMNYDAQKRTAVFDGDVVVIDPQVKISADNITATFATNNQPETITAVGNVRIEQTNRVAVCGTATYSVTSGKLVLLGKPKISRGAEVLMGSRIVFNRDSDEMICDDAKIIVPGTGGFDDLMK